MCAIKSLQGGWSVSLCDCSQQTAHFHYGNVALHMSLDDLRELGIAMQSVADNGGQRQQERFSSLKKGLVQ